MAKPMFTEKAQAILTYLQGTDGDITNADIVDATGIPARSVTGSLNGLQKKGLIYREEVEFEEDGKKVKVKYIRLTDEGRAADPDAEKE